MIMGPGTRLGRYEIITHLASGGMASVYVARMTAAAGFHRLVAIKRMHGHIAGDEQFVKMFMDEARLAARIRHPNVVPTLDLENDDSGLYLAMEFIEGDSLLGLLKAAAKRGERMPAEIALRVTLDALQGLHAAHELFGDRGEPLNLVHRDVSPHNILVGQDGAARITDFGIARAEERIAHTREGQIKGKLSYMAPETTSGGPFDRRADIFSSAVVIWECLAGRRMFKAGNDIELLRALLDNPIPHLREVAPEYTEALDAVLARALERDPEARFNTAADFADALEGAAAPLEIATQRAVAAYVKDLAGEHIAEVEAAVRGFTDGTATLMRLLPTGEHLPTAPGERGFGSGTPATAPDAALVRNAARSLEGPPSRKRAVLIGLLAGALVVLGAAVASVTLLVATAPRAQPGAQPAGAEQEAPQRPPSAQAPAAAPAQGDEPVTSATVPTIPTVVLAAPTAGESPSIRPAPATTTSRVTDAAAPAPLTVQEPVATPAVLATPPPAAQAPPPRATANPSFNPEAM
jgi:serine/threonine-protein kinase